MAPRDTADYAVATSIDMRGARVLDLGANIGLTALYYLEQGASLVDAVEPLPMLANRILALNHPKIHVHETAISNVEGEQTLFLSDSHNQGNSLNPEWKTAFPQVFTADRETSVRVTTLDNLFKTEVFQFVKIDVEGAELEVIQGADAFFDRNKSGILQIELYDKKFEEADRLLAKYFGQRYRIVYRKKKAVLVSHDSSRLREFKDKEKNPPNYIYTNSTPANCLV
jgi:FkbM family methyltransferase